MNAPSEGPSHPGGEHGRPRPRPAWGQAVLGCGASLLLVVGSLGAGAWAVHRKGQLVMDRAWKELRATAERLKTVESTKALYRTNPGLAETYATEGEFLKTVEGWRSRLGDVPERRPPLEAMLRDRQLVQIHQNRSDGHETIRMKFRFATGAVLELESDQGKLTALLLK